MADLTVTPVNPGQIKGNWGETKDKLKVKFPTLTDSDLRYEKGKKDEMLAKLQVKLGKTKEDLEKIIAEL
jgi:uncharacterized protein YjbJ (UPF0337 family)